MFKCFVFVLCAVTIVFCAPGYEYSREKQSTHQDVTDQLNEASRTRRQSLRTVDIVYIDAASIDSTKLNDLQSKESPHLVPVNVVTNPGQNYQQLSETNLQLLSQNSDYAVYKLKSAEDSSFPLNGLSDNKKAQASDNQYYSYESKQYRGYSERQPPSSPPPGDREPPPLPPLPPDHHPPPPHHYPPPPPPPDHQPPPPHHHPPPPPPDHYPPPPHHHHPPPPPPPDDYRSRYYDRYSYYNRPPPPPPPRSSYDDRSRRIYDDRQTRQSPYDRPPPPPHGGPPPPRHGGPPPPRHGGPPPPRHGGSPPRDGSPPPRDGGWPPRYDEPPQYHRGPPPDYGRPPPDYGRPPPHEGGPPDRYDDRSPPPRDGRFENRAPYDRQPPPPPNDRRPPPDREQSYNQANENNEYFQYDDNSAKFIDTTRTSSTTEAGTDDSRYQLDVRFNDDDQKALEAMKRDVTVTNARALSPFIFQAAAVTPEE